MAHNGTDPKVALLSPLPSIQRQMTYGITGAAAGACTVPIELLWQRFSSPKPASVLIFLRNNTSAPIYRASVRFWTYDATKSQLQPYSIPTWVSSGLSGAAGGFAETCVQSAVHRKMPTVVSLSSQSGKLFFCFGTYTYLSSILSPQQSPPRPFWYCWLLGAAAGGLGSGIISRIEGVRGNKLWTIAVPKGMLTVGTVIAVQVTSCAEALRLFGG